MTEDDFKWANQFDPALDEALKAELERLPITERCREIAYDFRFLRSIGMKQ